MATQCCRRFEDTGIDLLASRRIRHIVPIALLVLLLLAYHIHLVGVAISSRALFSRPLDGRNFERADDCAHMAVHQLGTMKSVHKLKAIIHLTRIASLLSGDFVEAGVAEGGASFAILFYLACSDSLRTREFHLFDTFEGLPAPEVAEDQGFYKGQFRKNLSEFHANAERWGERYRRLVNATMSPVTWEDAMKHLQIHVGLFSHTMPLALKKKSVVALFCDGDMYQSSYDCLSGAGKSLDSRAYIYHDDYFAFIGNLLAVKDWRRQNQDVGEIFLVPEDGIFTYYNEIFSSCRPPKDNILRNSDDRGKCEGVVTEAAFWQHLDAV